MSYYENQKDNEQRGVDYDLCACLENNDSYSFTLDDIERVEAVVEGMNDETDWHWILSLKDGSFVYATGGCDYTGWDCQSWAFYYRVHSIEDALSHCDEAATKSRLQKQISTERWQTWRTLKDAEFGMGELIKAIAQDTGV